MNKHIKHVLSYLLVAVMFITQLPATTLYVAAADNNDWTDYAVGEVTANSDGIYEISSAEELAWLAKGVNDTSIDQSANPVFKLTADIDLSEHQWVPLGIDYQHKFYSTFDGNGHTISGMHFGTSENPYNRGIFSGFIGYLAGSVSNLKITDAVIRVQHNPDIAYQTSAGILAGYFNGNGMTIKNCECYGSVYTSGTTSKKSGKAGGIVGEVAGGTMDSCRAGTVISLTDVNGNCTIGGITGVAANVTESTIKNCVSELRISLPDGIDLSKVDSGSLYAGGNRCRLQNSFAVADLGGAVSLTGSPGKSNTLNNVCTVEKNYSKLVDDNYVYQSPQYMYRTLLQDTEMTEEGMKEAAFIETLNSGAASITDALTWSIDADKNGGFPDLDGAGVSENTTVYYTVTFMSSGAVYKTEKVEGGKTVARPAEPDAAEGETFQYWYADDNSIEYNFNTPVTDDLTLTALWKGDEYTVRFDTGSGSYVYPQYIEKGKCAAAPDVPKKKGYSFDGWYSDSECNNAWSFDNAITGNRTLYAKWKKMTDISVSGRITDAKTGYGIRNAAVVLSGGQNAITDEFGYYRISGVSQGSYKITVTASGYNAASQEGFTVGSVSAGYDASLTAKSGVTASTVNVYANVSCVYSGIMLDGVKVEAVGEGSLGTYTQMTSNGGNVMFTGLPAGSYTFRINESGRPGWESYVSSAKELTGDYQLSCALKPNYQSLKINILGSFDPKTNQSNVPLAGKTVTLTGVDPKDENNELIHLTAYTDSKGSVTVDKLVPVTWKITCSDFAYEEKEEVVYADGNGELSKEEITMTLPFVDSSVTVNLTSIYSDPDIFKPSDENDRTLDLLLTGVAGTMTERIVRSGNPYAGGKVTFKGLFPGNYHITASGKISKYVSIKSGADGQEICDDIYFSHFKKKHFDVEFYGTGTASAALGSSVGATVNVSPSMVSFSGTLLKSDMEADGSVKTAPLGNTKIYIKPSEYYKQGGANADGYEITTDALGHYAISLAPGLYGVEVDSKYSDYFGGRLIYHEGMTDGNKGAWGWPCTGKWTGSKASAVAWMTSDDNGAYGDIGGMCLSSGTVVADLELIEKKINYSAGSIGSTVSMDSNSSQQLITGCEQDEEETVSVNTNVWNNYNYYNNTYQVVDFHPETRGAAITLSGSKSETYYMTGKTFPMVINELEPGNYSLDYNLSEGFSHLTGSVSWGKDISFFDFPAPGKLPASFPEDYADNYNPWPLTTKYSGLKIEPKQGQHIFRDLYDGDNSDGELKLKFYNSETYYTLNIGGAPQSSYDSWPAAYGTDIDLHWRYDTGEMGSVSDGVYKDPPKRSDYDTEDEYKAAYDYWDKTEYTGKGFPKNGRWAATYDGTFNDGNFTSTYKGSPHWNDTYANAETICQNYLVGYSTSKIPDKVFRINCNKTGRNKALPDGTVTLYFCAPKGKGYEFLGNLQYIRNRELYEDLCNSDLWFAVTLNKNDATECLVNFLDPTQCSSAVKILSGAEVKNLLNPRTIVVKAVEEDNPSNEIDNVDVTITYGDRKFSSAGSYTEQTCTGNVTDVEITSDKWECGNAESTMTSYDEGAKTETFFVPLRRKLYSCEMTVKDDDGNVVKGAAIRLTGDSHGEPVYIYSDASGKATSNNNLTYQDYSVYVTAGGYSPVTVQVKADDIKTGNTKNVTLYRVAQPTFIDDSVTFDRKGAFLPGVNFIGSSNTIEYLTNLGKGKLYLTVNAQVELF